MSLKFQNVTFFFVYYVNGVLHSFVVMELFYLLPWFAAIQRSVGPPINSINTDSWPGVVLCHEQKLKKEIKFCQCEKIKIGNIMNIISSITVLQTTIHRY